MKTPLESLHNFFAKPSTPAISFNTEIAAFCFIFPQKYTFLPKQTIFPQKNNKKGKKDNTRI